MRKNADAAIALRAGQASRFAKEMRAYGLIIVAVVLAAPESVSAQINKCVIEGKTVYQQAACPAGAKAAEIKTAPVPSPYGSYERHITAADIAAAEARAKQEKELAALCRARGVPTTPSIGMIESDLQCLPDYRTPSATNVTQSAAGVRKQLVFRSEGALLYFENGVLTSIQSSR